MKKFKFRLERVLQFRRVVKDERLRELLERRRQIEELQGAITALETELLAPRLFDGGIMMAHEVFLAASYVSRLKERLEKTRVAHAEAETLYQEALGRYIEAAREEKSLVTLREKRLGEYQEHIDKELQKLLDERATIQTSRGAVAASGEAKERSGAS